MKRTRFAPGQEPKILTSISDQCLEGKCHSCPGIFKRDDYPGESIFCVMTATKSVVRTRCDLSSYFASSQTVPQRYLPPSSAVP
jgi:hypothetical protein